jgi:twitching motility protein PilT
VHELTRRPRGLVLVTGPTGSGKSTSLAAMIDEINQTREEHIMTIEDPIEFVHAHKRCLINQRELGNDAQSFAAALKAALRQDPDVILVGEMRDLETISTALTAAETGHLVFATLHTQDAAADDRPRDRRLPSHAAGPGPRAAVGRAAGRHHPAAAADRRRRRALRRVRGAGADPAVRNLIREGKIHQIPSVIQTGAAQGMQTMDSALATLVRAGKITQELAEVALLHPRRAAPSARAAWRLVA